MSADPVPRRIKPRRLWTPEPHTSALDWPKAGKVLYVHITDSPGRHLTTPAAERAAIAATRRFHVETRGWDDIGYSYLLAQPWERDGAAAVYVGRGARRLPASQQGANRGNWSVSVLATEDERIMRRTTAAIAWLARTLRAKAILGHRDQNATSCPGDKLYAELPRIRKLAGL